MKVLIVSTSDRAGGAAVAASRLMDALCSNGVQATMLVRDKQTDDVRVAQVCQPQLWQRWAFLWERFVIFCFQHFSRQHLFDVDIANVGCDITAAPEFRDADVVHLHWVNQGMLSLGDIANVVKSGKPVVWTMHDLWPAAAICHLSLGCRRFTAQCGCCRYLPDGGSAGDLSARMWKRKERLYQDSGIAFVACSRWLEKEAKESGLLRHQFLKSIPNPIDTRVFHPIDRAEAREAMSLPMDKHLILFVAQRATNPYKGMNHLIAACRKMADEHPESIDTTAVVVIGQGAEEISQELPFRAIALGYVSDEHSMARIYSAADVFVLPSLSENLPNTIMEAMACGLPAVGFRVGGIPEEIDHQRTGYVAAYQDSDDLARGLYWTLFVADREALGRSAVEKVHRNYSQSAVSVRYTEIYQQLIAQKLTHL